MLHSYSMNSMNSTSRLSKVCFRRIRKKIKWELHQRKLRTCLLSMLNYRHTLFILLKINEMVHSRALHILVLMIIKARSMCSFQSLNCFSLWISESVRISVRNQRLEFNYCFRNNGLKIVNKQTCIEEPCVTKYPRTLRTCLWPFGKRGEPDSFQ